MIYTLDTNVCIRYLTGRSQAIVAHLSRREPEDIAISSIVKMELAYGAWRTSNPAKTLAGQDLFLKHFHSIPFSDETALEAGRIRATLAARGTPIGAYDALIAATAIVHNLTLITHNVKEFSRIDTLKLEDWEQEPPTI